MPTDDGTSGQALITDGSGVLSWSTAASGDVYGPASATDNAVARFDLTTGKIIQNSVVTIADTTGNMAGVGTLGMGGAVGTGEILALRNTAETTATVYGFRNVSNVNQATTTTAYGITDQTQILSPAALTNVFRFRAAQGGFTGTVTNQYGFAADSGLTGATNNYGFHSNIATGANRFNFYAAGTAANVFVGTTSIGGTVGSESLRATLVASAVNYLEVQGQVTTGGPSLIAAGSDTNIDLLLKTKGTGSVNSYTNGSVLQFRVGHTASAVNYVQVTGGATGSGVVLSAQGSDTNITMFHYNKGLGGFRFTNTSQQNYFNVGSNGQTAPANYIQVDPAAAAAAPILSAQGSDTNIDLALTPKGTGVLAFGTYTAGIVAQAGYITIKDAGGTTRNLLVG
jgi:hypothetical protein